MSIPPLKRLTLAQVAAGLDAGAFTVVQLVQAHLDQIARFDGHLRAVLQLNPRALAVAEALDAERRQTGRRGPLHGVPVLVKDNVATDEPGLEATAGSLALLGAKPARESPAVARLRAAGAVLLGTANCSEWANFRSWPSDSGWSARGGQTLGAYHAQQDPAGSSSGSAVALDMGFCVLAVGTETSGSIVFPAAQNSVVGLKPTTGLVPCAGVVPISPVQDTPGPMARTVADAAAMLAVMAGAGAGAGAEAEVVPRWPAAADYAAAVQKRAPLPTRRLGIPRDALQGLPQDVLDVFEARIVAPLQSQHGVTIVDCCFPGLKRFGRLSADERSAYMAGEFHDAFPAYLATLAANPQRIGGLADLAAFLRACPAEEYYGDGPPDDRPLLRNIERIEQAMRVTRDTPAYAAGKANAAYFAGAGGILGALEGRQGGGAGDNDHAPLDALLLPTSANAANYFAAGGGLPQITVPLGYRAADTAVRRNGTGRLVAAGPNVPYGVSVIGRAHSEVALLPLCAVLEALAAARDEVDERQLAHLRWEHGSTAGSGQTGIRNS